LKGGNLFLAFFSSGCNQSNLSTILAAKLIFFLIAGKYARKLWKKGNPDFKPPLSGLHYFNWHNFSRNGFLHIIGDCLQGYNPFRLFFNSLLTVNGDDFLISCV
jgi:hypothetical protein